MATSTYDPDADWAVSPRDHVRRLIGDIAATFSFFDEEIDNQLAEETAGGEATVYFAAAHLLEMLLASMLSVGKGIAEKEVGRLHIKFGLGERGTASEALLKLIEDLEEEGARRQTRLKGYVMRVLATN